MAYNKDFDSARVRFAFVFPDKYEIGISNLGVRIIYDRVNSMEGFMADRAYAPEPDFKPEFLYGAESKRALKDFDGIGFSLQYELSYPTVLKMIEMSGITVRNDERREEEPIIFAGGPCAFNPLPISDFIDVFTIGDGEEMMCEVCEVLERTKGLARKERISELCKIKGCWSKSQRKSEGFEVEKRISPLLKEYAVRSYPIPFSSSVHDRAIVEIRRGCGRMCRFCQPGHVTLPVREREAEEIIEITKELVKNTGYSEYSLLSLSSNDYSNINEVIKELSADFDRKNVSVSLPSQRIDGFNLELANLTQSVRKSTMTLAPEAGSQRLRNLIRKNISEEQIINVSLTLYENGWSKIKFYFIAGLPTETLEDMDEMAELLNKIKYRAKLLKKEKNLNHGFEITCTLSIFVPKPFTPFQWCPQMNLEEVSEHIKYLKEKTAHIKGLKINYHEKFVSQIEAVLTRGDDSLCRYVEALYKKGCYLDAWGEYFDKNIWAETAEECGFSLKERAEKEYSTEEKLPWDFINTGLSKEWLAKEYNEAFSQGCEFNLQPSCEHKCVNCGVCSALNTRKVKAKPYKASSDTCVKIESQNSKETNSQIFRYRLKITKKGLLQYFSHLDWQGTFHKVLARTGLNVAYSQGFNPSMKVSMGIALPLFAQSEGELVDIELYDELQPDEIKNIINKNLPEGASVINVKQIERSSESVDIAAHWAEYKIKPYYNSNNKSLYNFEKFRYDVDKVLSSETVLIKKKNKKGFEKITDVKKSIGTYRFEDESLFIYLKTGQGSDIPALRADSLMELVSENQIFEITRIRFFDENLNEM